MFVIENPGHRQSQRHKEAQRAAVNSHISRTSHQRRRTRRLTQLRNQWTSAGCVYGLNYPRTQTSAATSQDVSSQHPIETDELVSEASSTPSDCQKLQRVRIIDPHAEDQTRVSLSNRCSAHLHPLQAIFPKFSDLEGRELRSLHFYTQRTASEWSGWQDADFWMQHALQTTVHPSIKHALISLGAFHELFEMESFDFRRSSQKAFARAQGYIALRSLTMHHGSMSMSALLTAYIVIGIVVLFMEGMDYIRLLQLQFDLVDGIRTLPSSVPHHDHLYLIRYLEPIIDHTRARMTQTVDMIHDLRVAPASHFCTDKLISVPKRFTAIRHARDVLEQLLHRTTYSSKTEKEPTHDLPELASRDFDLFLSALDRLLLDTTISTRDLVRVSLLRISAKLGLMMIRSTYRNPNDEMFFDSYTPVYAELVDCFRQELAYTKSKGKTEISFGIDNGLLSLVGNASRRWCRDPKIRRELIELLYTCNHRELLQGANVTAQLAEAAVELEESQIDPPPRSCSDVPLRYRVKQKSMRIWPRQQMHVQFQRYPFGPDDIVDLYLPHNGYDSVLDQDISVKQREHPAIVIEPGYISCMKPGPSSDYYVINNTGFVFPIPAI